MIAKKIHVNQITYDPEIQVGTSTNVVLAGQYATEMNAGMIFSPITVISDGVNYWLCNGVHRLAAHVKLGKKKILANVLIGTYADAIKLYGHMNQPSAA